MLSRYPKGSNDPWLENTCKYKYFTSKDLINAFFTAQLGIVKNELTSNCNLMEDFNLNAKMEHRPDYHHKIPLSFLSAFAIFL